MVSKPKHGSGILRKHKPRRGRPPKEKALVVSDGRCIARVKTCSKCQYRYIRGDKSWNCPKCGTDRRCPNKAILGTPVCRMHGVNAVAKEASAGKYLVAHQIYEGYNRILGDPDLLNLTHEIAIVSARSDELFGMLNTHDSRGAHESITHAVTSLETVVYEAMLERKGKNLEIPMGQLQGLIKKFHDALSPVNAEFHLWDMLKDTMEMTRRLQDTERKWAVSNEGLIPVQLVLEVLLTIQRLTMKYIRNPDDRVAFGKEFRDAIPIEAVARL